MTNQITVTKAAIAVLLLGAVVILSWVALLHGIDAVYGPFNAEPYAW